MYIMQYNTGDALFRPVLADHSLWHTKRVHLLLCVGLGSKSCWNGCACSCNSLAARSNSPRRKVHVCLSTVRPRSWDVSKGSCAHQEQDVAPLLIASTGSSLHREGGGCAELAACHVSNDAVVSHLHAHKMALAADPACPPLERKRCDVSCTAG